MRIASHVLSGQSGSFESVVVKHVWLGGSGVGEGMTVSGYGILAGKGLEVTQRNVGLSRGVRQRLVMVASEAFTGVVAGGSEALRHT
ncbi:hypothetical protein E2C01_069365 [Portunus trituberculatus]|uniref:Uncharacterized protein n=1 Tax=Portunus trituberculatus TaxID=210409 RepID=A0A5B7HUC0_PORTR|nr:hypothetical protein [Portunus trituberculatus]